MVVSGQRQVDAPVLVGRSQLPGKTCYEGCTKKSGLLAPVHSS